MFQILSNADGSAGDAALRAMFAARKQVFVDLLRWDVPVLDGRFEIDQFDDDNATYLILLGCHAHLSCAVKRYASSSSCISSRTR